MASGTLKNLNHNHRERIYSFPYTPTHSGIISLLVIRGDSGTSLTYRTFSIYEDGTNIASFEVPFQTAYAGTCVCFPCIANHTYTLSGDNASSVAFLDIRTNIVY